MDTPSGLREDDSDFHALFGKRVYAKSLVLGEVRARKLSEHEVEVFPRNAVYRMAPQIAALGVHDFHAVWSEPRVSHKSIDPIDTAEVIEYKLMTYTHTSRNRLVSCIPRWLTVLCVEMGDVAFAEERE